MAELDEAARALAEADGIGYERALVRLQEQDRWEIELERLATTMGPRPAAMADLARRLRTWRPSDLPPGGPPH